MPQKKIFLEERVERDVKKTESTEDCWLWQGPQTPNGYGTIRMTRGSTTERWLAHRAAWTLAHGPIPEGLVVRHKCDVKLCCNVNHLELGTPKQNARDAIERNRYRAPVGSHAPWAKLNEEKVLEIRKAISDGVMLTVLAEKYGVTPVTIHLIKTGKTWKHVGVDGVTVYRPNTYTPLYLKKTQEGDSQ